MTPSEYGISRGVYGTVLERIVRTRIERLESARRRTAAAALEREIDGMSPCRGLIEALRASPHRPALIAELKKASPSKGLIREDFDPEALALTYERHGASAVSVLTEEDFFRGSIDFLGRARRAVGLPVLRKDFLFDPYMIVEARARGADAVLLMASLLDAGRLRELYRQARSLGLDVLLEVHDEAELETALSVGARLIGVNNRDLKTLRVDPETTLRLLPRIPADRVVVTESGIGSRADVERFRGTAVGAMLVGTAIMKSPDPGGKIDELLGLSGSGGGARRGRAP